MNNFIKNLPKFLLTSANQLIVHQFTSNLKNISFIIYFQLSTIKRVTIVVGELQHLGHFLVIRPLRAGMDLYIATHVVAWDSVF